MIEYLPYSPFYHKVEVIWKFQVLEISKKVSVGESYLISPFIDFISVKQPVTVAWYHLLTRVWLIILISISLVILRFRSALRYLFNSNQTISQTDVRCLQSYFLWYESSPRKKTSGKTTLKTQQVDEGEEKRRRSSFQGM